ncbi:S24 family peptidase [Kordiimonas aestuarii]|uniref:S24 family peptidase n=1 Tax=Kordiimonas aestuarii TaxID=1005925 RepID=UPI0021CE5112|nr:S24 family peptidase [Kordiimonas aestuarii]
MSAASYSPPRPRLHRALSRPFRNTHGTGSSPQRPSLSGLWSSQFVRDLPVLGRAQGGSDGNIVMEDSAIDWAYRPVPLEGVADAFAVLVTGDSMVPKYAAGDLVYVNPEKQPRKGRYVLVELDGHKGLVKQFDRWDGDTLVLHQFNPASELRFDRREILRVLLIIGSMDA